MIRDEKKSEGKRRETQDRPFFFDAVVYGAALLIYNWATLQPQDGAAENLAGNPTRD